MTLDEAWAEAEAALPEGWTIWGLQDPLAKGDWQVTAASPQPETMGPCECCGQARHAGKREYRFAKGNAPAAALHALAQRMQEAVG